MKPKIFISMLAGLTAVFPFQAKADDHGNTWQKATLISANSAFNAKLAPVKDQDFFKIVLTSAGSLVVESRGNTDTVGSLLDVAGKKLKVADNQGSGQNFRIAYKVPKAGIYYIGVRHKKINKTGAYRLLSRFVPALKQKGQIALPFAPGRRWHVCQGYNTPEISHFGALAYSLDLSNLSASAQNGGLGCLGPVNAAKGEPVYAPADGKVAWIHPLTSDILCLTLATTAQNGARAVMLGHFTASADIKMGTAVKAGQLLGHLNAADNYNGHYAHIHVSAFRTPQCMDSLGVVSQSIPLGGIFGAPYNFSSNGRQHQWYGSELSW